MIAEIMTTGIVVTRTEQTGMEEREKKSGLPSMYLRKKPKTNFSSIPVLSFPVYIVFCWQNKGLICFYYLPARRMENLLRLILYVLFSGISKGINFDDYKNIKVNVTGDNIPPKINTFADAHLRDLLMNNLQRCKYDDPTPVQKYAIPIILSGRDLMATAQTGSGKTVRLFASFYSVQVEPSATYYLYVICARAKWTQFSSNLNIYSRVKTNWSHFVS